VFTLREAARHLGLPASTLRSWARASQSGGPLITALEARGREASVPFIGFAEAYVLSAFRRAGVPMQRIRSAVDALNNTIGIEHALASRKLYTDGAEVLYDYAVKRDDGDVLELTVVRTGQHQFSELVRDYLKLIAYGSDGWAAQLQLPTDHRAQKMPDEEWLADVGQRGWVVLMKDTRIRRRPSERVALAAAGVRAFCLVSGQLRAEEQTARFVNNLGRILRQARNPGPRTSTASTSVGSSNCGLRRSDAGVVEQRLSMR
jgi:hypothetical protein